MCLRSVVTISGETDGDQAMARDGELAWWNGGINIELINFILACGTREI